MKIQESSNAVVNRDGLATDNAFTMQFNAKMAKILSDGLYADKVQSIIRELSCNAVDSHVASGQPERAIEVHLPTSWEPWFYVRDFGTGLDHQQIISHFTRYGASNKTDSNQLIGQLGLGCKSPFSYVDAFDVTAVKDGVRRQYSMYKNEEGMPSVALLDERNTDEANGVTVKMPVKAGDIVDFANKASRVYRWFTVKPTILGRSEFKMDNYPVALEGTDWALYMMPDNYTRMPAYAVMGLVAYPIERDIITQLSEGQSTMLDMPISMTFEIGELEISASREALGYDARTQAAIRRKLDSVITELTQQVEQQFKSATTLWEAKKIFYTLFEKSNMRHNKKLFVQNGGIAWNNTFIKSSSIEAAVEGCELRMWHQNRGAGHLKMIDNAAIYPGRGDIIIINDEEGRGKGRVRLWCANNMTGTSEIWYYHSSKKFTHQQLIDHLGNPPNVLFTSQLPAKARAPRRVNLAPMAEIRGIQMVAVDLDMSTGGVYVPVKHSKVTVNGNEHDLNWLTHIVNLCKTAGVLNNDQSVYAPRLGMKKKISEQAGWQNLFDLIDAKLKTFFVSKLQTISDHSAYTAVQNENLVSLCAELAAPASPTSEMAKFMLAVQHMKASSQMSRSDNSMISLAHILNAVPSLPHPTFDLKAMQKNLAKTYPMLPMTIDHYYGRTQRTKVEMQHMINYVNMVDDRLHASVNTAANQFIQALGETA